MTRRNGMNGKKRLGRIFSSTPDGKDLLLDLFNQLRASYLVYREGHWTVGGNDYYGNHLLLKRVYEETEDQIDAFAEMLVGSYGPSVISSKIDSYPKWAADFRNPTNPMLGALKAANKVRSSIDLAYDALKKSEKLTLAWDDFLMSLAREKDSHLYLLKQATGNSTMTYKTGTYGKKYNRSSIRSIRTSAADHGILPIQVNDESNDMTKPSKKITSKAKNSTKRMVR